MINYEFDQDYVTCVINIPIKHKFKINDVYSMLNYLKYYNPYIHDYIQLFNYNKYNVIIKPNHILMENIDIMSINTIDNILVVINDLWRVLKFPGFITKYEIITKICSRKCNSNNTIYNENDIIVPIYDIIKILYSNNNSLFHYIPMDVINVICDYT